MSVSLEPAPELQGALIDLALRRRQPPQALLDQAVSEWLAKQRAAGDVPTTADVSPMLALFAEWDAEDETDDLQELARRRHEWEDTRTSLEASPLTLRDVSGLLSGDAERGGGRVRILSPTAVVLDTPPLGLLTQKKGVPEAEDCRAWAAGLERAGCLLFVPEIADYELRREFLRRGNAGAVSRLDRFNAAVTGNYLPLTTAAVRLAASLWAQVRNQGRPTAPHEALDGDALGLTGVVVATVNVGHLSALTDAALWSDIQG